MKAVVYFILLTFGCVLFGACEREPDKSPVGDDIMPSARADAPSIVLGMTRTEVAEFYSFVGEEYGLMTTPSQFRPARDIISRDNVRFTLAFDDSDRVCAIQTNDEKFRLPNGIGVGSTYAEIKQLNRYFVVVEILGYGRMVKLEEGTLFGFPWKSGEETHIGDDEKVVWMELEQIPLVPPSE